MKLLIITHSYPPKISPRAFRWSAIAEHWARNEHQVDVVCSWIPGTSRDEVLNGVHLYRVGGSLSEFLRSKMQQSAVYPNTEKIKSQDVKASSNIQTIKYGSASLAKWIHDQTWKKVYWPDYACLWYFPALLKARELMKLHYYDAIISVSHPFTGHLVGISLRLSYPYIKWIVDVGDPFCFAQEAPTNNQKLYQRLNYFVEEKIFLHADAITVTTEETLKIYADLFTDNAKKISVIPPLLSLGNKDNDELTESLFLEPGKIRIIFAGSLYKTIRRPNFLLRLFSDVLQNKPSLAERLELHFIGKINDCKDDFDPYKALIGKEIFIHGIVKHNKAKQAIKEADILVNIGNATHYHLPSKIVEYAMSGKPMLNIVEIDNDSSTTFLNAYPGKILTIRKDDAPELHQINQLIDLIENLPPPIESRILKQWLLPFSLETVAAAYEKTLIS